MSFPTPYSLATSEFEKTNWGWQLSQLQQRFGEWLEFQLSQVELKLPQSSLPQWLIDLFKVVAWLLLGLLVIWLGWLLWRLLKPYLHTFLQAENSTSRVTAKTSNLSVNEWLERSQAYFRQGNYREACRCLYMATLQHLNDTGIATHQSSRTDKEYLQLLEQQPQSQSYQTLIATHEQLCFGNAEISPENFEQCRQAYREIAES